MYKVKKKTMFSKLFTSKRFQSRHYPGLGIPERGNIFWSSEKTVFGIQSALLDIPLWAAQLNTPILQIAPLL
jgi:hypothetical protein